MLQSEKYSSSAFMLIDLQARSLLSYGLYKRLIDPCLNEDYSKEEMEIMMIAARLCLMHSSSRRPTMKMVYSIIPVLLKLYKSMYR